MITFDGTDYFSSGPSRVEPGPIQSRDAIADTPGTIGSVVINQGTIPRALTQRGALVADTIDTLQVLVDAIQSHVGAGTATLCDQYGKTWTDCLMQRMDVQPFTQLGPRYTTAYEITYLQAHP